MKDLLRSKVAVVAEASSDAAYYLSRRRTLAIRHATDDRIVAMAEIVSPGNKHSQATIDALVEKSVSAVARGIHLLIIDILPATPRDPNGMHGLIWEYLESAEYEAPAGCPLTFAAYRSSAPPTAFVEPAAVGDVLPEMPLFLTPGHYVNVPLEPTYIQSYAGMPLRWREVIEGTNPS